jgi:phosphate:Na+ symporter
MKVMSDGIQRAAGSQMRKILGSMTKNRFLGVFTGFLITALVQSSSATTVMTVSFVNAGLLTLVESAGVMMGANIGTTVTGWIIALLGFKVKLSAYSIPFFAIAIPLLFAGKGKLKYWGEFLVGFAILFLGLSYLKDSVPDIAGSDALNWIKNFSQYGLLSRIFFVFVGALVTVVVQSSTAAMAITLTLVYAGWLPLEVAAAMVLGENIGTTITAEVASLVGNTTAKRSARIHSMFNIIGVTWMVLALPWAMDLITLVVENFTHIFESNKKIETEDLSNVDIMNTYKLAAFHTFFNLVNVLFLLPFVPFLVKAAIVSVKGSAEDEDDFSLKFIGTGSKTPELALLELQKEAGHFGSVMSRMSEFTANLINSVESKKQKKLLKKIKKYEKISDRMEEEVTNYITKLSGSQVTPSTSQSLRSMLNICNDLERIGDVYFQISKSIETKNEEKMYFTPKQRENLNKMGSLIDEAFEIMVKNLNNADYASVTKDEAKQKEKEINAFRDTLREEHLSNLGNDDYNVKAAMIYNNVFHAMERVGDHIINVTEAVIGEI